MDKYFPTQELKVFTDKDFSNKVHNTLGMCNLDTELEISKKLEIKNPFILFFQDGKINGIFNGHKTYSCLQHFILSKEGMKEFL